MIVLAIDTCMGAVSAAVIDGGAVLAASSEAMWRGHQERLGSMVAQTMDAAKVPFSALGRVGATVGPGSFTGLRVGVAFVKGLAVALDIPVVGVGTLEAFAFGHEGRVLVCADARRGQVYWQVFDEGAAVTQPAVSLIEEVAAFFLVPPLYGEGGERSETGGGGQPHPSRRFAPRHPPRKGEGPEKCGLLLGPGAHLLAAHLPDARVINAEAPDPVSVARLVASAPVIPIAPLYLRPPDAKLPGGIDP